MTTIIFSEANVRAAKAALHSMLPLVRSGHLAEALAAGLGRRQWASVVAALREGAPVRPPLCRARNEAFRARLGELGYRDVGDGFLDAALAALPDPIFVFHARCDRAANDRHYRICNRTGRPMLMVRMARRYAELEWDCITVDGNEEDYLHDRSGSELARIMFNLFQARARGAPGKPIFLGSAFTGTITRLLPDTAVQLAEDYFQLLYLPLLEPRGPRRRAA